MRKASLFILTTVAALAAIDAYLQFAEIQTPMETRIDPELGPTYIPNKRITRFNEGFFMGAVNEYGYMGPGCSPSRVGSEKRVLLLGDSFVLGHTVLPRQYFGRYLEKELQASRGFEVRALNFGKADFNFGNMYQYFHDFAGRYDHDVALFFVGEGDLVPSGQAVSNLYPTARLEDGEIVIDKSFRESGAYRFYKRIEPLLVHSSVLRLAFNTYKVINSGSWKVTVFDKLTAVIFPEDGGGPAIQREPSKLSSVNRAILRKLAEDRKNILVIQTAIDPALRREIDSTGIPIIDLGGFLEGLRSSGKDPYYWPVTGVAGHWNHSSQPLIGLFLADRIAQLGLL